MSYIAHSGSDGIRALAVAAQQGAASGISSRFVAAVLVVVAAVVIIRTLRRLSALVATLLGLAADVLASALAVALGGVILLTAIATVVIGAWLPG